MRLNINEVSLLYLSLIYCIFIGCILESSCCLEGGGVLYYIGLDLICFCFEVDKIRNVLRGIECW